MAADTTEQRAPLDLSLKSCNSNITSLSKISIEPTYSSTSLTYDDLHTHQLTVSQTGPLNLSLPRKTVSEPAGSEAASSCPSSPATYGDYFNSLHESRQDSLKSPATSQNLSRCESLPQMVTPLEHCR